MTNKEEFLKLFPQYTKDLLNLYSFREVANEVKKELVKKYGKKIKFSDYHHGICLRKYKCKYNLNNEIIYNPKFCVKERNNYYFTQDWVEFLKKELITDYYNIFES